MFTADDPFCGVDLDGCVGEGQQERLGHSSVSFTFDRYSHAIPAMQQDAAGTVARLVGLG